MKIISVLYDNRMKHREIFRAYTTTSNLLAADVSDAFPIKFYVSQIQIQNPFLIFYQFISFFVFQVTYL